MKDLIRKELAKHPGVSFEFRPGGRHHRVVMSYQGRSRFVPYSSTRIDRRAQLNNLTLIRQELRNLGALQ